MRTGRSIQIFSIAFFIILMMVTSLYAEDDYENLSFKDQVALLNQLKSADQVNKGDMSIRWTGFINPPSSGNYIFEQLLTCKNSGDFTLTINGQVILDKSRLDTVTNLCRSQAVALTAGTPVAIVLEYSRAASAGFPMAVLMWESESLEQQIVPNGAFTMEDGKAGLLGQYYSDANWTNQIAERIDPAIDFIWDREAISQNYTEKRRNIIQLNLSRITNEGFLSTLSDEDLYWLAESGSETLLGCMTASQRLSFIHSLAGQKQLLEKIELSHFVNQLEMVFMLPGKSPVEYWKSWSSVHEQPRTVAGLYIGGAGDYVTANLTLFKRAGEFFREDYFSESLSDIQSDISFKDESCNLLLAEALVYACNRHKRCPLFYQVIDNALANKDLTGDPKATWLIAKAFAKENLGQYISRPGYGMEELKEGLLVAKSPEMRLWVVQEMVARLVTIGKQDEAQTLVSSLSGQFANSDGQKILTETLTKGTEIAQKLEEASQMYQAQVGAAYVKELKRREAKAKSVNNTEIQSLLRAKIDEVESVTIEDNAK